MSKNFCIENRFNRYIFCRDVFISRHNGQIIIDFAGVVRMADKNRPEDTGYLARKIEELGTAMEKMKLAEYVELLNRPARLFYLNFFAGIARGLGMAVGFTILGAFIIYTLQRLQVLNLPVIGEFIADIVKIVQNNLRVK